MTPDSLNMIRRGWQDGATTVAPRVPGLADLLDHRLEEAIRLGTLDERSLLAIVDQATKLAADSGSADIVPSLTKRLRRGVYEYLLSLDAVPPADRATAPVTPLSPAPQAPAAPAARPAPAGQPAPEWNGMWTAPGQPGPRAARREPSGGMLIGADEAAALGRLQLPEFSPIPLEPRAAAARPAPPAPAPAPPAAAPQNHPERPSPAPPNLPHFRFHIGDPDDVPADAAPVDPGNGNGQVAHDSVATGDAQTAAPRRASFADPSTWPKPVTPTQRPGHAADAALDLPPEPTASPSPHPGSAPAGEARLSLSWPSPLDPHRDGPSQRPGWPPVPEREHGQEMAEAEAVTRLPDTEFEPETSQAQADAATPPPGGWAVRQPETVQIHLQPLTGGPFDADEDALAPFTVEEVPESDLRQLRASIELKLRKKKCDDAAAMLQQAAHELGGQAVAEMALDIGDRCRALGRGNAALNCYLAASRADPIFEPPLARLADICIGDHDIDLAVSYLERIARLTRLRGDNRGALRVYRKIATIAPYRDDVLEMLMRAQMTGRLEP